MAKSLEELRRVVTGRGPDGRSKVLFDGPPTQINRMAQLWTTASSPASIDGSDDAALIPIAPNAPDNGSMFWIVRQMPGNQPPMHSTRTIDYGIVLEGEVTLVLDDEEVHLHQFDCIVQQGTSHKFENRGSEPNLILFVLLDAEQTPAS